MKISKTASEFDATAFSKTNKYNLITSDENVLKSLEISYAASGTSLPVLLLGDTGVGKEIFANYIHKESMFRHGAFMPLNCGAIPKELVESKLFGHTKGAFTGVHQDQKGIFEKVGKGTVFLDEVADLPLESQVKLLRVLENGTYFPVGSQEQKHSEARIIAATNANIEKLVLEGKFRKDLYYRLRGFRIQIPSLKERKNDIKLLAGYFLYQNENRMKFSNHAMAALMQHPWDGNVRELKSVVDYGAAMSQFRGKDSIIRFEDVKPNLVSLDHDYSQENQIEIPNDPEIPLDDVLNFMDFKSTQEEGENTESKSESKNHESDTFPIETKKVNQQSVINDPILTLGLSGLSFKEIETGLIKAAFENSKSIDQAAELTQMGILTIKKHEDKHEDYNHYETYREAFDAVVLSNLSLSQAKSEIVVSLVKHFKDNKAKAADMLKLTPPTVQYHVGKDRKKFIPREMIPLEAKSDQKNIKTTMNEEKPQKKISSEEVSEPIKEEDILQEIDLKKDPILGLGLSGLSLKQIETGLIKAAIENSSNLDQAASLLKRGVPSVKKHVGKECSFYERHKDNFEKVALSNLTLMEAKTEVIFSLVEHLGNNKSRAARQLKVTPANIGNYCNKERKEFIPKGTASKFVDNSKGVVAKVPTNKPISKDINDVSPNISELALSGLNLRQIKHGFAKVIDESKTKEKSFLTKIDVFNILGQHVASYNYKKYQKDFKKIAFSGMHWKEIRGAVTSSLSSNIDNDAKTAKQLGISRGTVSMYKEDYKRIIKKRERIRAQEEAGNDDEIVLQDKVSDDKTNGVSSMPKMHIENKQSMLTFSVEETKEAFSTVSGRRTGLTLANIGRGIIKSLLDAGYSSEDIAQKLDIGENQILKAKNTDFDLYENYKKSFKKIAFVKDLSLKEMKAKVVHALSE